jgi:hypothetical protein
MSVDAHTEREHARLRREAVRILARSLFRELRSQGYSARQIVGVATELLGQVTRALATTGPDAG